MYFPRVLTIWGTFFVCFTALVCRPYNGNAAYEHETNEQLTDSIENAFRQSGSTKRPLLADDVFPHLVMDVINASTLFFLSNEELLISIKTKLIKDYNDILHKKDVFFKHEQDIDRSQEHKERPRENNTILTRTWSMYTKGSFGSVQEKKLVLSSFATNWAAINKHVLPGSFMEIGGCEMALTAGRTTKSATVIAVILKLTEAEEARSSCSNRDVHNVYIAKSTPARFQGYLQNIYADYKVLLNNVYLTDFTALSEKLLPHEYVEILSMIFSMSKKIFITNVQLSKAQELYFKEQWLTPGSLFNEVCSHVALDCNVAVLWGYDAWSNADGVYSITVAFGRRTLARDVCLKLNSQQKCYASYNETSPNMTVVFDNSRQVISPVHASEIHLKTLLNLGMTEETKEMLFVRLLQLPYEGSQTSDLFVKGSTIIKKKLRNIAQHLNPQKDDKEQNSNTETFTKKQPSVKLRPKGEQLFIKQSVNDAVSLDHGENRQTRNKGIRNPIQQFGGGWERESNDKLYHQREYIDEMESMEREVNPVNVEIQENNESFERKELSDEEKEIHKGLDFLQSRTSFPNKDDNKISVTNKYRPAHENTSPLSPIKSNPTYSNKYKMSKQTFHTLGSTNKIKSEVKSKGKRIFSVEKSIVNSVKQKNTSVRSFFSPSSDVNQMPQLQVGHTKINDSAGSTPVRRFRTLYPKESGERLQKLLFKYRTNKRQNKTETYMAPNKRRLLSYSSSVDLSHLDTYGYYQYTRKREQGSQSTSNNKSEPTKKPVRDVFIPEVTEELLFDGQWQAVKSHIMEVGDLDSDFSIFIYGQKRQSLFGTKVSMIYPKASVITAFPPSYAGLVGDHRKMLKFLPDPNNLVFSTDLSITLVRDLVSMPELFKFQVLSLDVFRPMMLLGDKYPYYLGQILTMAETTFLEIPHFYQLMLAKSVFSGANQLYSAQGVITDALHLVGAEAETIETLKVLIREDVHSLVLRIKLKSMQRKVVIGCDSAPGTLTLLPDGAVSLSLESTNTYHTVSRSKVGVGLNMLLRMGLHSQEKTFLFQEYLKLPIHSDMCPSHIVWVEHRLKYQPITEEPQPPAPHTFGGTKETDSSQITLDLLIGQMENGSFSFLDYNSRDNIGFELASQYPNSTFVSLLSSLERIHPLLQGREERNITNIVLNVVPIDTKLITKLMTCPDFLRYQFIDYDEVLRQMKLQVRDAFDLLIGQVIATGVTTFMQVPSSKILSLAAVTFHLDDVAQISHHVTNNCSNMFQASNHPLDLFKDAEDHFLFESAKADVEIKIAARVLSPSVLPDGAQLPWKLVKVDVKHLKVEVNHHFDYARDGHKRKYTLHCDSNDANYSVYLVRSTDGFKIPYGNVNAISLIALLRMGLQKTIKDEFYSQFLRLPLYEDMAPWNIVFRAGHLDYIDYDSKDVTFNKMAAAAYQIMAMLMNYKRTVEDFGRCKTRANTPYGFDNVAECVSSQYTGPCTNTRYPVPCGDQTCRATYIDCLKALQDMELSKNIHVEQGVDKIKKSENAEFLQWSFNLNGPSKDTH